MKADIRARLESAAPLIGAYLLLATLYAWQAWRRETPTIFSDELETTQISRAIAETGHAARRGEPYGFTSLVPWLTAPFWWLHPVATAYESIKTVQAFVMAAAIFPAFLLARRLLSPGCRPQAAGHESSCKPRPKLATYPSRLSVGARTSCDPPLRKIRSPSFRMARGPRAAYGATA